MSTTANLGITHVEEAQSQKEVTLNTGLDKLDEVASEHQLTIPLEGNLATGDNALHIPINLPDGTIVEVEVQVQTASTSGAITAVVDKATKANWEASGPAASWTDLHSTPLTIDQDEFTVKTAATPPVLGVTTFALGDRLRLRITVTGTGAADALAIIRFRPLPA